MNISVIIPTFNRSSVLRRSVKSVLSQSFKNLELIVVDDGSTDSSIEVLNSIDDNRLSFFSTENKGVSAARNFGVSKSKFDWVAFLDSDDEWLSDKLEKQLSLLHSNKDLKIIHGEEIWIRNGKRVNKKNKHQKHGGLIFEKCLPLCFISPSTVLIRKDVFLKEGGFDENFVVCEDYDLWLKLSSLYEIGFVPDEIIKKYGGHEDQLSFKFKAMDLWRVRSLEKILKIRDLSKSQKYLVKEEIVKKARILKMGYLKHKNLNDLDYVEGVLKAFSNT